MLIVPLLLFLVAVPQ
ncbi:hypothetical protein AX774_g7487, partial [Zancudomyces culisetae]